MDDSNTGLNEEIWMLQKDEIHCKHRVLQWGGRDMGGLGVGFHIVDWIVVGEFMLIQQKYLLRTIVIYFKLI